MLPSENHPIVRSLYRKEDFSTSGEVPAVIKLLQKDIFSISDPKLRLFTAQAVVTFDALGLDMDKNIIKDLKNAQSTAGVKDIKAMSKISTDQLHRLKIPTRIIIGLDLMKAEISAQSSNNTSTTTNVNATPKKRILVANGMEDLGLQNLPTNLWPSQNLVDRLTLQREKAQGAEPPTRCFPALDYPLELTIGQRAAGKKEEEERAKTITLVLKKIRYNLATAVAGVVSNQNVLEFMIRDIAKYATDAMEEGGPKAIMLDTALRNKREREATVPMNEELDVIGCELTQNERAAILNQDNSPASKRPKNNPASNSNNNSVTGGPTPPTNNNTNKSSTGFGKGKGKKGREGATTTSSTKD